MRLRLVSLALFFAVLLSGCAGFDAGRALRFGVDLLGAACSPAERRGPFSARPAR